MASEQLSRSTFTVTHFIYKKLQRYFPIPTIDGVLLLTAYHDVYVREKETEHKMKSRWNKNEENDPFCYTKSYHPINSHAYNLQVWCTLNLK